VRHVLVTGGAGFIGSHLCDALLACGDRVTAVDTLETGSRDNLELAMTNERFRLVVGDVCDERLVQRLVREADIIVHLAARIGLKIVIESPAKTLETNVHGTDVVLNVAASHHRRTLLTSTSEVYGLATRIPSSEEDPITFGSPMKGRWSYACAKAYDEFLALALHRERMLPATVARLFNTVGPRQTARYGMVLPRFVRQALSGEPLTVYGDGTQTRCFCYVGDVVGALVAMLDEPSTVGDVYNLGNPEEVTILELARRVIDATHSKSGIVYIPFDQAYESGFEEIHRRVPNISKLRSAIGYAPATTLDEIIASIVDSLRQKEAA
jgi:UDP-glucose 4-epimerase